MIALANTRPNLTTSSGGVVGIPDLLLKVGDTSSFKVGDFFTDADANDVATLELSCV